MPPPSRLGDTASGHGSFPPTVAIGSSPDTFINGIGSVRLGDAVASHGSPSPSPPHSRATAAGSPDTFVNGKPITRIGDAIGCGGLMVEGSGDTIVN